MFDTTLLRCDEPWVEHLDPTGDGAATGGCLDETCELAAGLHPVTVACSELGCHRCRTDVVRDAA